MPLAPTYPLPACRPTMAPPAVPWGPGPMQVPILLAPFLCGKHSRHGRWETDDPTAQFTTSHTPVVWESHRTDG